MTTTPNLAEVDLSKVDLTDLSYFEDGPPYELFARMRSEASPHWNALTGDEPGFWSFTKAADIADHQPRPRHVLVRSRRSVHDRPGRRASRGVGRSHPRHGSAPAYQAPQRRSGRLHAQD